jgi:hypothetical protein
MEYNNSTTEIKDINNTELEAIKSYATKISKSELSLSDLEKKSNSSNSPDNKSNKGLYIGLTIGGVLIGIIV